LKKKITDTTSESFGVFHANTPQMKLNDLFVPAWRHSNPKVRLKAIEKNHYDENILTRIIETQNEEMDVVFAAIDKLQNLALCEKLFLNVYGNHADEKRKRILQKITDEQQIHNIYWDIRKKGGKSFLEIALEQRLFERWETAVEQTTDTDALVVIAQKSLNHFQGSYVSSGSYQIACNAIEKITDLEKLSAWVQGQFASTQQLHYSVRNGLLERLKQKDSEKFFSKINDTGLLLYFYKSGETSLLSGAEKRLSGMGNKIRVEEYDKEGKCSSCDGSGGGDVRIPYTDNDWEWEKCEHCNGTGRETFHIKEYFIESLSDY